MFDGRVVASREAAVGLSVVTGNRCEVFWPSWRGTLPGTLVWCERMHGPIPTGWRVVSFDPCRREVEIAGEWYAPTLRLVALTRRLGDWLACGASMARAWWGLRPRRVRDAHR